MTKIQNSKQCLLGHLKLEFGNYLGFVIWSLGFRTTVG
jgi:hypothetical protein